MKKNGYGYLLRLALAGLALLLALACGPGTASAQLRPGGAGDSGGPISVSADRLEADDPAGVVTFSGAVVARQGEMTITCDRMRIYYLSKAEPAKAEPAKAEPAKGEPAKGEPVKGEPVKGEPALGGPSPLGGEDRRIDRVECEGGVKVVEGDHLAVGDKALYLAQALPRRIVLTGRARVWQGRDSLTGSQVTYYLDDRRSLVEGGRRERVRTVYHQDEVQP